MSRDNIVMDVVIAVDALNWVELWSVALKFLLHDRKAYILVEEAMQSKLSVHAHFSAPREKVINSSL